MVELSDGGFALAGTTQSTGSGDILLVRTDANGNQLWNRTYGGPYTEGVGGLLLCSDGGFLIVGQTYNTTTGNDVFLVRTDKDGNQLWNHTYDYGGDFDAGVDAVELSGGGFAVACYATISASDIDMWLIRIDSNGALQWSQTYDEGGLEYARDLVLCSDGGFALAGYTETFSDSDFLLVKTDSNGNKEWSQTYGGVNFEVCYGVVELSGGGFALAGDTASYGGGAYDFWLVVTDSSGGMLWSKSYGGSGDDHAKALALCSDGGFALAGFTDSFDVEGLDALLVRTDANGNLLWAETIGGSGDDQAWDMTLCSDGGFALAGDTTSYGAGDKDFWLTKCSDSSSTTTTTTGTTGTEGTTSGTGGESSPILILLIIVVAVVAVVAVVVVVMRRRKTSIP